MHRPLLYALLALSLAHLVCVFALLYLNLRSWLARDIERMERQLQREAWGQDG